MKSPILFALTAALLGGTFLTAQDQVQVNVTVNSTMDIYRAGGYDDGSNGIAPLDLAFASQAVRTISFPRISGAWTCQDGYPTYGPDGSTSGYCVTAGGGPTSFGTIGPFSGIHFTDFVGPLMGMFLEDSLPILSRPALRFYVSDRSEGGTQTDFLTLKPQIGQVFFIGDGQTRTGAGQIQTFDIPVSATHLYLGYVDTCMPPSNTAPNCYSDNVGTMSVTVRLR